MYVYDQEKVSGKKVLITLMNGDIVVYPADSLI